MFVKGIMKPLHQSITTNIESTIGSTLDKLNKNDIQGMPVLDGDRFVGMISKQIIYKHFFKGDFTKEVFLNDHYVNEFVEEKDLSITINDVFEKTLPLFKDFSILAVVDEQQKFLGLVTRDDVLDQFESAFGTRRRGVRIAFTSTEAEGRIARLGGILEQYHENVISLATFDETDKLTRRIVLKLEEKDNIDKFTKKLERSGFRVLDIKEI
ncbi:CBS domain-containing protein [Bacillaceae bacterium S4-13-58]